MNVNRTQCEVLNGNPRKEAGEDGTRLAYDISVEFAVPRETVDKLIGVAGWTDQFYSGEDTRLEHVFPIRYQPRVEDLKVTLHVGLKPMVFEAARLAKGTSITPQSGGYCKLEGKIQVYPTRDQSGRLDEAVKEFVDIEIAPMTADLMDAA